MRIVLDTNVVVSGLLRSHGAPAEILRLVARGEVQLCCDTRILAEYQEVLRRPRFKFDAQAVHVLLEQVEADGISVVCESLDQHLPDRDDEMFVEAALAAKAVCLVTGNLRHFPPQACGGLPVLTPRQFLDQFADLEK